MKSITQLLTISALALSTVGASVVAGCAAPPAPLTNGDGSDDSDGSESADTHKLPKSGKNTSTKAPSSTPAPEADPTTPPATTPPATPPTTPPTTPPAPGGNAEACMEQCASKGAAAQYWACSAKCQDQQCDDTCWTQSCGQNEQACGTALDACAQQCGFDPGGGADQGQQPPP